MTIQEMRLTETKITSLVYSTAKVAGFHSWPGAPPSTDFLAQRHRHIFHIKVAVRVLADNDRKVEFFFLQKAIEAVLRHNYSFGEHGIEFKNDSCETIALNIFKGIRSLFQLDAEYVEVSEDGENGAIVGI